MKEKQNISFGFKAVCLWPTLVYMIKIKGTKQCKKKICAFDISRIKIFLGLDFILAKREVLSSISLCVSTLHVHDGLLN